jgi:hypothetical protein
LVQEKSQMPIFFWHKIKRLTRQQKKAVRGLLYKAAVSSSGQLPCPKNQVKKIV